MKKVLFVATVVKTHIMEFHIPYLQMFKEMGWETVVAAKNDYDRPSDCVIPYTDRYYDIPFERSPLKLKNYKAYKELKRVINNGDYDIVHCHTPVGAMLTRLAALSARKKGTKVIYTAHGFHFFKGAPMLNWLLYYPVEKVLSRWTDVLITINKEDYQRAAKRFHAKRIEYVPGVGINLEKFHKNNDKRDEKRKEFGFSKRDIVLLSVGELNSNKNHQIVIRALGHLNKKNVYYVICGQGPLKEELAVLADKYNVSKNVILAGYRTDVKDFYQMADIFVFPSLREGLSVAMMEAMACGLPIVCNEIRGNTDLIKNQVSGCFAENDCGKYGEIIGKLCDSYVFREKLGQGAQEDIKKFDIKQVKRLMKDIYLSV